MSRFETPNVLIAQIDKNGLGEHSFIEIFSGDEDFTNNEEYFREDTLDLGYRDEAERVSKEIFHKAKEEVGEEDEYVLLGKMLKLLFEVPNFIGSSSCYGESTYEIIDTEFEYIIAIAYTTQS
jgi:hypothetical protein